MRKALAAIAALLALVGCEREPKFKGTDITGAEYGRSLALDDASGRPRSLQEFRGKVVVLSFGYTQCPDVCPTTLADIAAAMKALGDQAGRVQVLFITLDPARDVPAVLAHYVPSFDARFIGLRGDEAATQRAAREFKVFYEKRPGPSSGTYTVDHSAQVYVLDTQGRLRLFLRHTRLAGDLADDIRALLAEQR